MMDRILADLASSGNLRTLPGLTLSGKEVIHDGKRYLNLSSNDYLGVSCEPWHREFMERAVEGGEFLLSNPSSRLVTGNGSDYEALERAIEELYGGTDRALVLGSGYLANTGVLPALTSKEDMILADKLVHASLIDGMRLSEATWKRFPHNDMEQLERLLVQHANQYRQIWVVTESLFSMDGDRAPMQALADLKARYGCKLYVDEAHAFGVCGLHGRGIASEAGVERACDIRVATLGKAAASQGAFVLTNATTREVLVNRMRTLIFSTALPPISLRWSREVILRLPIMEEHRQRLRAFSTIISGRSDASHIIPLMAGSSHRAIQMSQQLREGGFWVTPIRTPTVPVGKERVRISLSAALTADEIEQFKALCDKIG